MVFFPGGVGGALLAKNSRPSGAFPEIGEIGVTENRTVTLELDGRHRRL